MSERPQSSLGIPCIYIWCMASASDNIHPTVLLPVIAATTSRVTFGVITFAANISVRTQVDHLLAKSL